MVHDAGNGLSLLARPRKTSGPVARKEEMGRLGPVFPCDSRMPTRRDMIMTPFPWTRRQESLLQQSL